MLNRKSIFVIVKISTYLYFIFSLIFSLNAAAQPKEFELQNLTQENGLPGNESYFIYRDSKNYLWIATDQGVVRYNGNKMEHFDLPDNVVFKIREDNKGRIWFFSHTGRLAYFFNGIIYPYKYNDIVTASIKDILIIDAYVKDNDEIIIAGTYNNYAISGSGVITKTNNGYGKSTDSIAFHISEINPGRYFTQQLYFNMNETDTTFISLNYNKKTIHYAVPAEMQMASQYGCVTFDQKTFFLFVYNKIIKLNADGSFKVKELSSKILCANTGNDERLWVGLLKQGVVLLDKDLNEDKSIQLLKDKSITSITNDYEGGTWLASLEKGIYYLKNTHVYKMSIDSGMLKPVFRLHNINDSVLLFANENGISQIFGNKILPVYKLTNDRINDLFIDNNNLVFVAGKFNLSQPTFSFAKIDAAPNSLNKPIAVVQSSSEMLKMSAHEYLFCQGISMARININKPVAEKGANIFLQTNINTLAFKPNTFFRDINGKVLAGTINNLYKLETKTDSMKSFMDSSLLLKKGISAMRQMDNGIYTVGIRFGGIALIKNNNVISNITTADGLQNNSIKYLMPLKDQLWAATSSGISVISFQSYSPVKYTIINIGKKEGFYNLIINQLISYKKNVLAATSNGIYVVENPSRFPDQPARQIPLYINSINYYKGDTSAIDKIIVPYQNNRLKIRYSAVCFSSPDEIKYYYRLDKNDTSWQSTASTELLLENLSPGIYDLELKAGIPNQQRYTQIQKLKIIVQKPWWQNNWLRMAALFFLLHLYSLFIKTGKQNHHQRESESSSTNENA